MDDYKIIVEKEHQMVIAYYDEEAKPGINNIKGARIPASSFI